MCSLLTSQDVFSQNSTHKWAVGVGYSVTNMEGLLDRKALRPNNYTGGVNLFIGRYLSPSFNFRLAGLYGNVFYPKVTFYPERELGIFNQQNFVDASFLVEYKFNNNYVIKENSIVQPYFFIGLGINNMNRDLNTFFPFGGGLKFKVTDWVAINLETSYKANIDNSYSYFQHHAGLIFSLGKNKKEKNVANTNLGKVNNDLKDLAIITSDYDKDGLDDSSDECPYVFGSKDLNGCPDSDADNIGDSRDRCPTEKGTIENQGCPLKIEDTDGDGVEDNKDKCPTEKGLMSNSGCPFVPDLAKIEEASTMIEGDKKLSKTTTIKIANNTELFYLSSSSDLSELNRQTLDAIALYINENNVAKVVIKGYTSHTGTDKMNIDLSLARAIKASNYLSSRGVNFRKMSVQGWGHYNAKYNNLMTEEAYKNQRVEVVLE